MGVGWLCVFDLVCGSMGELGEMFCEVFGNGSLMDDQLFINQL